MDTTPDNIADFLTEKGVKPTANRILVVRQLLNAARPVSLANLESELRPMDKSAIFRVLEVLAEKDIVHVIEDGSRSVKYEMCHNPAQHTITDQHVHFFCESCKDTICLEHQKIPQVVLPEGYTLHGVNFVVKGLCPKCRQ